MNFGRVACHGGARHNTGGAAPPPRTPPTYMRKRRGAPAWLLALGRPWNKNVEKSLVRRFRCRFAGRVGHRVVLDAQQQVPGRHGPGYHEVLVAHVQRQDVAPVGRDRRVRRGVELQLVVVQAYGQHDVEEAGQPPGVGGALYYLVDLDGIAVAVYRVPVFLEGVVRVGLVGGDAVCQRLRYGQSGRDTGAAEVQLAGNARPGCDPAFVDLAWFDVVVSGVVSNPIPGTAAVRGGSAQACCTAVNHTPLLPCT